MKPHMTNTRNTSAEALEHACPVRVREYAVRRGSGGDGAHRGGDGLVRSLELLAPTRVTVIADRRVRAPYGLAGGKPGARGETRVRARSGEPTRRMPGKFTTDLAPGAIVTVATPGGGGFGARRRSG